MWGRRCGLAGIAGAFGFGILLMATCSINAVIFISAGLLVILSLNFNRWN